MGIFGPFQSAFGDRVDDFMEDQGHGLTKAGFVTIHLDTQEVTSLTVQSVMPSENLESIHSTPISSLNPVLD
jgi:hypothetical protein